MVIVFGLLLTLKNFFKYNKNQFLKFRKIKILIDFSINVYNSLYINKGKLTGMHNILQNFHKDKHCFFILKTLPVLETASWPTEVSWNSPGVSRSEDLIYMAKLSIGFSPAAIRGLYWLSTGELPLLFNSSNLFAHCNDIKGRKF